MNAKEKELIVKFLDFLNDEGGMKPSRETKIDDIAQIIFETLLAMPHEIQDEWVRFDYSKPNPYRNALDQLDNYCRKAAQKIVDI